jgi:hypothetical protein
VPDVRGECYPMTFQSGKRFTTVLSQSYAGGNLRLLRRYFRNWRIKKIWEPINRQFNQWVRVSGGKDATPSVAIIDSQSVQISSTQSEPQAVGCDGGKKADAFQAVGEDVSLDGFRLRHVWLRMPTAGYRQRRSACVAPSS